jgi:hypothetical protein
VLTHRVRILFLVPVVACVMLAAAPSAIAAVWYVSDATHYDVGYVVRNSATRFTIKRNSGASVGSVIRTSSGWRVRRNGRQVAVLRSEDNPNYRACMFERSRRTGRCRVSSDENGWGLERWAGSKVVAGVGWAPTGCPARVALGAARLLLW